MFINYEREIIMKIQVGPAELLSPLHPFCFFVFPLTVLTNPSWAVLLLALSSAKFSCWFAEVAQESFPFLGPWLCAHIRIASPRRKKMPRIVASTSLGEDANANLASQKAQQRMHLDLCHGAVPFIWMVQERLSSMELPAFPWRKNMTHIVVHSSLCGDTNANLASQKAERLCPCPRTMTNSTNS